MEGMGVKQERTDWKFSLHLQIQGYSPPPTKLCESFCHSTKKKKIHIYTHFPSPCFWVLFLFSCASEELGPLVFRTKLEGQENK